ncbi:MAG TPA: universal stress protein [Ktedonobacterales bacterium]|nr:universal stress protein [Ktedonobacterales bacterium]
MFSRILVPLDGSQRAESALPVAAKIARAANGSVVLVQSVNFPSQLNAGAAFAPALYTPELIEAQEAEATRYLQTISTSPVLTGIHTDVRVFTGTPAISILDSLASERADLIVMTSHGRTGLARWALGSVAQQLVRHAPVPVFVLREHGPSVIEPHPDMEHLFRVLVPLDGSPLAETSLEPAAALVSALTAPSQGALHLVLVLLPYEADTEYMPEALAMQGAKSYLGGVAERLRTAHAGLHVTWTVAAQLDVASAILRVAERGDDTEGAGVFGGCDMIAMATHGYSGLKHWMMGSVTERMLESTKLPVLIVRPVAANDTH